jgi:diaminopimelate epimerase
MKLEFAKYHGTGNDFVMVCDLDDELAFDASLVAHICDRRFGVGADGLIRLTRSDAGRFFMDYRNADGSVAEMCGNGVRCVGRFLADRGLVDSDTLELDTRAGVKELQLHREAGQVVSVTVDMGPAAFAKSAIPMRGPAWEDFQMQPVKVGDMSFTGSAVNMGNPHLVLFVDEEPRDMPVLQAGPQLEFHESFPEKTNVEFVKVTPDALVTRVWERGIGETMACGTGACAVLVAANEAGLFAAEGIVRFPGGDVEVARRDDTVFLTGRAEHVFDGTLSEIWMLERKDA